jgi:hypothetical protein
MKITPKVIGLVIQMARMPVEIKTKLTVNFYILQLYVMV